MTTTMTPPEPHIALYLDEADDLARLLSQVEDWLRHSDLDAYTSLVDFFNGPGHGHLAVAGLIDLLATPSSHPQPAPPTEDHVDTSNPQNR
jgi:hypothetical protein